MLVRIDEARQSVLAFHVHDFRAGRNLQLRLRDDGVDPFTARDDCHVGPQRDSRPINDRGAGIDDNFVFPGAL